MKKREASLEELFHMSVITLSQLMTAPEVEPLIKLRAAQIVFVHLVDGVDPAVLGREHSGARVSWEQYIKSVKKVQGNGGEAN